ncbi:MAG TPA: DNA adenine methylase [Verrucomicrobiae bacterium]|nr:DNA adenine methylase [Verrucomicrobiae bacterium]
MILRRSQPYETADREPAPADSDPVKPPFGYYGAKQRISAQIVSKLPRHNAWVEAFCGSAAITLAKPAAPIEVINDLDGNVVNLFAQLREQSEALCRAVALTPYSREEFRIARSGEVVKDPLERARRFLVATMMTVNGTAGSIGCGFSFSPSYARSGREARVNRWYNLPERLALVVERLRNVRVENRDARDLVNMFIDRPATLIYMDPPYFVKRAHGYAIDAREETFHRELLDVCQKSQSMLLLSGYANELYDSLLTKYAGWERVTIETHTRDTSGKDYAKTEVLWKNFQYVKAEKTGRLPIRLSQKELREKKLNPSRSGP